MVANNGVNNSYGCKPPDDDGMSDCRSIKKLIFNTCCNEGVDDLTARTVASLVYDELYDDPDDSIRMNLITYKRARAFEEPDVSKEMAEFGKAVSKIIVEEIIMNENITVLK